MQQIGHAWRTKPGKAEEYARFHAQVWPEVEQVLRDGGVTKYVMYRWGDVIFSHMEVEDYEAMAARFNADPAAQRWEEAVGELIEYVEADPSTGWPLVLEEVWSL
ncbi:MAG: L-rhamnose mutarotase [Conexibacter sp.]